MNKNVHIYVYVYKSFMNIDSLMHTYALKFPRHTHTQALWCVYIKIHHNSVYMHTIYKHVDALTHIGY